jgi:hypothetical protein
VRIWPAFVALFFLGCGGRPTPDERALVSKVEAMVLLPKGGGKLQCYERHYALLKGKEIDAYVGFPLSGRSGRSQLLVGRYRFGGHPGVYWAKSAKDLPPEIMDGGCDDIAVFHLVGDPETSISAKCSPTIAGVPPDEITPPRKC